MPRSSSRHFLRSFFPPFPAIFLLAIFKFKKARMHAMHHLLGVPLSPYDTSLLSTLSSFALLQKKPLHPRCVMDI